MDSMFGSIGAKVGNVGKRMQSIGTGTAAIGAGVTGLGAAVVGPIVGMAKAFADTGSAIADASARTGASASSLSEIGYAAEQTGTDLGTVENGMKKLQVNIAGGSEEFAKLGLDLKDLQSLSPEKQFETVGKKIAEIDDPAERAAAAVKVFGKSGTSLLPLFDDFDSLTKEARELGISLSDTDASNADRLGDAFDRVSKVIGGIGNRIGAAVAEPLADILEFVAKIGSAAIDWVKRNEGVVRTVAAIGAGLVAAGAVITTVGGLFAGVGVAVSGIGAAIGSIVTIATTVFGAIGTAIAAVLSPIGLVVAGIVGIGGYLTYMALEATGGIEALGKLFGDLGGTVSEAWGGIVDAISAGDLELAGEIAFAALEVGWLQVTTTIQGVWEKATAFLYNVWAQRSRIDCAGRRRHIHCAIGRVRQCDQRHCGRIRLRGRLHLWVL